MSHTQCCGRSRADFAAKLWSTSRAGLRSLFVAGSGLFAGLVLIYSGVIDAAGMGRNRFGWVSWIGVAVILASLVPLFAAIVLVDRRLRWQCPACAGLIRGARDGAAVIAMGRCPQCEAAIWDEPETSNSCASTQTDHKLPAWESLQAQILAARPSWRPLVVGIVLGIAVAVGFKLSQPWIEHLWQQYIGVRSLPFLKPLLAIPTVLLAGWGLIRVSRDYDRQLPRCPQPGCGETLGNRGLIHATGRCPRCGRPCLSDPLPRLKTRLSDRAFERPELQSRIVRWRRVGWLQCILGGVAAFGWFGLCQLLTPLSDPVSGWRVAVWWLAFPIQLAVTYSVGEHLSRNLHCPECSHPLVGQSWLAVSSSNCPGCGCRIVVEESAARESLPLD